LSQHPDEKWKMQDARRKSTDAKDRKRLYRNKNAAGNKARVITGEYETIT
jgi:hypothetical protein